MTDAAEKKKLEQLLERLRKQYAQTGETMAEIEALMTAQPTTGQQIKALFGAWSQKWGARYRSTYVYGNNAAIAGGFKRLLKGMDVDEVDRRMTAFLESRDRFYVDARHPVEMFIKVVNKFGADDAGESFLTAPVIDCKHRPACTSDQEHTRRAQHEMRGAREEPPF